MKKWTFVALLLVGATILGGTVLREPIASAAQSVSATIVGPLDANGNLAVHEQGTAAVHVDNSNLSVTPPPATQHVVVGMGAQAGGTNDFPLPTRTRVSLFTVEGVVAPATGVLKDGSETVLLLHVEQSGQSRDIALTQPVMADSIELRCPPSDGCSANFNVLGS